MTRNARLVFARTESDNVSTTWTAIKTVEVELPFMNSVGEFNQWQLIGAEWIDYTKDGDNAE